MNLKLSLMSNLIENNPRRLYYKFLKIKKFVTVPILDQGLNSIISFIGNIYILAKLEINDFAAAGFTISFSYFTVAIVKNKYITTLNYTYWNPQYTALSLLKYLYKKLRLHIVIYGICLWIFLITTTHNLIIASILLLLGLGLFTADLIRNICIIKNIQKISVAAGVISTSLLLFLIVFGKHKIDAELLLLIYSIFQFSYICFMVIYMRRIKTSSDIHLLQLFFKKHISTTKLFQNESLVVSLLNILSISVLYLLFPQFYSSILIAYLFSASIPMFFSNALLPSIQTTYNRNRSNFAKISFLFWFAISVSTVFFALLSHIFQEQISSFYTANTIQAFEIIFGVVAVNCAISLYQIFYLPLRKVLKNRFLVYRSTAYTLLTVVPIFGALWKNSKYYVCMQILLLLIIGMLVLFPVFSKKIGKVGKHVFK